MKATLSGAKGIRVNEICFVATDSRFRDANRVAQLAAATLGDDQDEFKQWLNDPQKLLEMIAAAQGARNGNGSGGSGFGPGSGSGGGDSGAGAGTTGGNFGGGFYYRDSSLETTTESNSAEARVGADPNFFSGPVAEASAGFFGSSNVSVPGTPGEQSASTSVQSQPNARGRFVAEPTEDEILGILSALTSMGQVSAGGGSGMAAAGAFHEQMSQLPGRAQDTLKAALAEIASHAPDAKPDQSTLIQLAEHLAIRFALDRYEKDDVKVNAVRQMLDRLNTELGFLYPHHEREDLGKITQEGRYRVWKEIWTLNYLGRSAKYR